MIIYIDKSVFSKKVIFKLEVFVILIKKNFSSIIDNFLIKSILNLSLIRKVFIRYKVKRYEKEVFTFTIKNKKPKFTIVALNDADKRFIWLAKHAAQENINLIHIPRILFSKVFKYIFIDNGYSPDIKGDLGETSPVLFYDKKYFNLRKKYKKYCQNLLKNLIDIYKLDILLLPKLNDDWIIDLIKASKDLNLKIVVHDREHGLIKNRMEIYPSYLKEIINDLIVDKLFLTNKKHLEFWEKSNFPKNKMVITGKPDIDYWKNLNKKQKLNNIKNISPKLNNEKIKIIFFAFGRNNYLNFFYPGEKRNWEPLANDFHNVIKKLLKRYHEKIQIIYKIGGKPSRDSFPGLKEFVRNLNKFIKDNSLIIMDQKYSTLELLSISDAVLGFHTLGIVEAMFTEQPIFYGAWGNLFYDIKDTLIPFHNYQGLTHIKSQDSLFKIVEDFINNPNDYKLNKKTIKARENERSDMYFKPDGNSSKRIIKEIKKIMNKSISSN